MESLPDAVYFKDLESRFIRVNRGLAAKYGHGDPASFVGKTDFDLFEAANARGMFEEEQEIIRTGKPLLNMEHIEVWNDRQPTWALVTKMPLQDEAGRIVGTFGVSRDITERKLHERKLETVATVSGALRNAANRAQMLPIILDQLFGLLKVEGAALAMLDPVSSEVVIEQARGEHWVHDIGLRLSAGEGITAGVIASGQPYVNNDMLADASVVIPSSGPKLPAAACAPLIAQGQTIGAIWIGSQRPIDASQVHLLTTISNIAGAAIQRATLFEQTQRRL
jgi:PAS domain S-box-containing protein